MGYIQRRDDRPKPWLARYKGPDGHHHSKAFRRKVDAEKWLHVEESKSIRGEWVDPTAGKITYGDWSDQWRSGLHSVKPKTLAGYESLLRSRVLPTFSGVELRRISTPSVRSWVASMVEEGLSPDRIRQAHQVLSASLDVAVDDDLIVRNPCDKVKLPPIRKRRQLFLTSSQVAKLAEAAESHQEGAGTLVLLLGYSGLRWGEATALRPSSIDIGRRRIRVTEAWSEIGSRMILSSPKTHEARTVIIPSFLARALETYMAGGVGEWVFPGPNGRPLRSSTFRRKVWLPAVEAADGVPDGLLVHDLRDTAASLAISAGASIKAVQRMLGHASAAMTLDTYGSLFDEDLEDLADRMEKKYGPARGDNVVRLPR